MLKILERYIAKSILTATLLAALIIVSLLFIMALLSEFKSLGVGDYNFASALLFVFLRLPNAIYQFSPLLILVGSIIGISLLSNYRELAVMRAAGFSMRRIIQCILMAAFMMILVISIIGELTGPSLNHRAEIYKENLKNAGKAVVTTAGIWLHIDNNFIHIDHVVDNDVLEGVTRYEFDDQHRLKAAFYAKTMTNRNGRWVMQHAVITRFLESRTMSEEIAELPWELTFNNHLLSTGRVEPGEMTLSKLIAFSSYLEKNGLQSSQYRFEFWQRIFMPLASMVMVFLAIPFVLGVGRQSAMGWRLLVGIIAGVIFFLMNSLLGQICIVYQVPAVVAALIPIVIFAGVAVGLSKFWLQHA